MFRGLIEGVMRAAWKGSNQESGVYSLVYERIGFTDRWLTDFIYRGEA